MDETTVFTPWQPKSPSQTPQTPSQVPPVQPQSPQQPVQQDQQAPIPPQPSTSPSKPQYTQSQETPPSGEGAGGKPILLKIVKLLIGLAVLSLIFFVVFILILPNFNKPKAEKTTITYWGLFEDQQTFSPIISEFEQKNPNIKIAYDKQDIKDYREKLETRIKNGTGPDIFRFHNTWLPQLNDSLLPLPGDVMKVSDFKENFYPVTQKDLLRDGAIYGIPLEIDTLALYVNSDVLKNAGVAIPTNWTDFINTARSLTVKDQNNAIKTAGAAMGTFDNITHAPDLISLLLVQNGVDLYNVLANKDRAVDALSFYTSFTLLEGNVWDQTLDPSILAFSRGNLAMYFGYLRDFFTIKELAPSLAFQIAPVPQLPEQLVTIASYWSEGVSVKSKNQREALLFLRFLSQKETQDKLYNEQARIRGVGLVPARSDLGAKYSSDPVLSVFVNQAKPATSTFFTDGTFDNGLNTQMNGLLGSAINSILSGSAIESTIENLASSVSQALSQY